MCAAGVGRPARRPAARDWAVQRLGVRRAWRSRWIGAPPVRRCSVRRAWESWVASCAFLLLARHRLDSLPKSSPKTLRLERTKGARSAAGFLFGGPRVGQLRCAVAALTTLELALRKPRRTQRAPPVSLS